MNLKITFFSLPVHLPDANELNQDCYDLSPYALLIQGTVKSLI